MSGRGWQKYGKVRYYRHRWPSVRAIKKVRQRVKVLTGSNRSGMDIRDVIALLNPVLRGWGSDFRTGNAAKKFRKIDDYVVARLRKLLIRHRGRNPNRAKPLNGPKTGSPVMACTDGVALSAIPGACNHA